MGTKISITNIDDFDNSVIRLNDLLNKIRGLFDLETKSLNELFNNSEAWRGNSRDAANEKYQELSSMYPSICTSLENYVSFLRDTAINYRELEESVNNDIETNNDMLNVN